MKKTEQQHEEKTTNEGFSKSFQTTKTLVFAIVAAVIIAGLIYLINN